MKKLFSKYAGFNQRDLVNGLVMAVIGAVTGAVLPTLQNWVTGSDWALKFDWHTIVKLSVGAAVTYLIKNFFSNSSGDFLGKEK